MRPDRMWNSDNRSADRLGMFLPARIGAAAKVWAVDMPAETPSPRSWQDSPNNPTRRQRLVVRQGPSTTGLSPFPVPHSRGLGSSPPLRRVLQATIRTARPPDSKLGLFPLRSPLLGESSLVSFPPLIDMLKLSW
ncbi:hypothetical protein ACH5RR_016939 [Cinchona calisaya]|uniref:Uncharacterized protein n=1 Tax=Cinchona calisaya TaxID=153742 RepID=A0ABD2ZXC2_9GENT